MAKPLGPGGLPLPRPDNSVTWAITDGNKPIADGVKQEAGPLKIYNYADYIDPATVKKFQKQFNAKVRSRPTTRPTRRSRSSGPDRCRSTSSSA